MQHPWCHTTGKMHCLPTWYPAPGSMWDSGLRWHAVLVYIFMFKSKWGYEIRMTGNNAKFASYSGINVTRVIIIVHVVAGAVAGPEA